MSQPIFPPPRELLARLAGRRVLVVGDPCLDEYRWGRVHAIAQEAPVACLDETERASVPGQAANVAANAAALGGRVTLLGPRGDDAAGERLEAVLAERGIASRLVRLHRPTTERLKLVATHPDRQHLFHSYRESREPLSPAEEERLLAELERLLPEAGTVVVSDYGNGAVFRRLVERLRGAGVPWVGDTRRPLAFLAGAACLKPNRREVELWAREAGLDGRPLPEQAEACRRELGLELLCLTLGGEGLLLLHPAGMERRPALCPPHLVGDFTGAGDTVTAALVLALAADLSPAETAELAAWAAAEVVARPGTSVPPPVEAAE